MSKNLNDGDDPMFEASLWCIRATGERDGFYTHGYPLGKIDPWPHAQFYQSKAAAVRQLNKLAVEKRFANTNFTVLRVNVTIPRNQ